MVGKLTFGVYARSLAAFPVLATARLGEMLAGRSPRGLEKACARNFKA